MANVNRILVIKLSALGDLFHAVPIVHLLKEAYGCPIDWVTQPEYVELVRCHRDVENVWTYPRKGGLRDLMALRKELRKQTYDLVLDLQGLTKSGLVMGLAKGRRKIAPAHHRELCAWFANEKAASTAKTPHAMDHLLDTLRWLEVDTGPVEYPLDFPEVKPLEGKGVKVALAPRSRWPAKDWPEQSFVDLAHRLKGNRDLTLYLLGGPADQELGERMAKQMGSGTVNLCGAQPLLHLGGILKQMDVLVSNDSGPMHFAAAVGTPLVALFGPTDPEKTGPWGEGHCVIRPEPGPEGYPDHRSYKNGDRSLISKIPVEEVERAVLGLLSL